VSEASRYTRVAHGRLCARHVIIVSLYLSSPCTSPSSIFQLSETIEPPLTDAGAQIGWISAMSEEFVNVKSLFLT
jgi:hypothetical protein